MNSFRNNRLRDHEMPLSTESSNRIEGVTVAPARLYPLVLGKAKPRDRSEQEVQDYRRALNEIHSDYAALSITPDTLLRLHSLCQSAAGDAGQFKRVDNDIVEFLPGQAPVVRFRCVKAAETPAAVEELCRHYQHALDQENVPPLIAIAALALDFLCIHPFRDGNGRVSRLLTLLALYQHGYEVGRYISPASTCRHSRPTGRIPPERPGARLPRGGPGMDSHPPGGTEEIRRRNLQRPGSGCALAFSRE